MSAMEEKTMKQNTNDSESYREALESIRDILKQKSLFDDETARIVAYNTARHALNDALERPRVYVDRIQNFNFTGMCSEQTCSRKYTHYITHVIDGVTLLIPLCKEHADIIEECEFEKQRTW